MPRHAAILSPRGHACFQQTDRCLFADVMLPPLLLITMRHAAPLMPYVIFYYAVFAMMPRRHFRYAATPVLLRHVIFRAAAMPLRHLRGDVTLTPRRACCLRAAATLMLRVTTLITISPPLRYHISCHAPSAMPATICIRCRCRCFSSHYYAYATRHAIVAIV